MKKELGVIYTVVLVVFIYTTTVLFNPAPVVTNIHREKVIDTIVYPDYSKLYTLRASTYQDNCIEFTVQEAQLLMKISREEGGPTLDGQLWTMRTILNRLYDGSFGNTIWEIVSADKQFDVVKSGTYTNADVNSNSHVALAMIEGGWDETEGALYWRTNAGSENSWHENNLHYIKTVEGNRYYK